MQEVAIIGGGAAGLFTALYLKYQLIKEDIDDVAVIVYERLERTGKKILATGNGRCNLSNSKVNKDKYNNPEFVKSFIRQFGFKDLKEFLYEMGLYIITDEVGRAYPHSETATTVLDVLRTKIKQYGIEERCNSEVKKLTKFRNKFVIETVRNKKYIADYVVMTTGGKAAEIHGSNGSGYSLLKTFKHKVIDPKPGLVSIKTDEQLVKGISGVRVKTKVSLYERKKKEVVWTEFGEVLFKNDGLSGIVIMQASSYIQHNPGQYYIHLDLYPTIEWDDLFNDLKKRVKELSDLEIPNILLGMFPKMVGMAVLKRAKVDLAGRVRDLKDRDIARIINTIKEFEFEYKGTADFDKAQVTIGGIDVTEVSNKTLESKKVENLYIAGELLDIDGDCGGFNLHWAFASGVAVAKDLVKKIRDFDDD